MNSKKHRNSPRLIIVESAIVIGIILFFILEFFLEIFLDSGTGVTDEVSVDNMLVYIIIFGIVSLPLALLLFLKIKKWKNSYYILHTDKITWEYNGKLRRVKKELDYDLISSIEVSKSLIYRVFGLNKVSFNLKSVATAMKNEIVLTLTSENADELKHYIEEIILGKKTQKVDDTCVRYTMGEYLISLFCSIIFLLVIISIQVVSYIFDDEVGLTLIFFGLGTYIIFAGKSIDGKLKNKIMLENDGLVFFKGIVSKSEKKITYDNIVNYRVIYNRIYRKYKIIFNTIGDSHLSNKNDGVKTLYISKSKVLIVSEAVDKHMPIKNDFREVDVTLKASRNSLFISSILYYISISSVILFGSTFLEFLYPKFDFFYTVLTLGVLLVLYCILIVLHLFIKIEISNKDIKRTSGIIMKNEETFNLDDINALVITEGILARIFKFANLRMVLTGFNNFKSTYYVKNKEEIVEKYIENIKENEV